MLNHKKLRREETLDRVGLIASSACAVHCMLMPFVVGLLPLLGLGALANERTEWLLVIAALCVGLVSLLPSYFRQHRRVRALALFASGLGLIFTARLLAEEKAHIEVPVVVAGACLIAAAHFVNLKLCRSCRSCVES